MQRITLSWKGKDFVIRESEAFEAGEAVEEIVTLAELASYAERPKFRKLARCYGALLRFAGASVTDAEIHSAMMDEIKAMEDTGQDVRLLAADAVSTLMHVLMDGAPADAADEGAPKKKTSKGSSAKRM